MILDDLYREVLHSRVDESLILLRKAWKAEPDASRILDLLSPLSLYAFSQRALDSCSTVKPKVYSLELAMSLPSPKWLRAEEHYRGLPVQPSE
jgi:hypothetical protein